MRRSKYGEKTVVMRIPEGLVPDVRKLLQSYEVIHSKPSFSCRELSSSAQYVSGFKSGFKRGFEIGEEYQVCLSLELSGQSKLIPDVINSFRTRTPQDVSLSKELVQAFSLVPPDISNKQFSFRSLLLQLDKGEE